MTMPRLSLILCSRNDSYMGNSRWRLETTLNYIASQVEALALTERVEILVADWGSDVPLSNVINLSPAAADLVSFVLIPPGLARERQGDSPFAEVIALNAVARRARGEYVGRIDQDTLAGTSFLRFFFDLADKRLHLGVSPETTLFFSSRRRIPFRFAVKCPSLANVAMFVSRFGRRLKVEHAPKWAPFYVTSVGIWLVHRDLWHECGGYDEEMIYMGAMESNMIARLMKRYQLVDLGKLVDHDFYHLEHYNPWVARHCYTFRKGNDDYYRTESRLLNMNVNPSDWGLANCELSETVIETKEFREGSVSGVRFAFFILVLGAQMSFENLALAITRTPARITNWIRTWSRRAMVATATVAGKPIASWPRALRQRWDNKDSGVLVFPRNIYSVQVPVVAALQKADES